MAMLATVANVKIDDNGDLRCWKCGSKNLESRRKTSSKAAAGVVGVAVFAPIGVAMAAGAKKRIRCIGCGEYNDPNPEPWTGVAGQAPAKQSFSDRMQSQTERDRARLEAMREVKRERKKQKAAAKLEAKADKQAAKEDQKIAKAEAKAEQSSARHAEHIQAGHAQPNWYPNPDGTPTVRWWDGSNWTDHIRTL